MTWELLVNLAVRDFKLRYKQSILGFAWAILNPLGMMVVLTIVFSVLFKSPIENFPVFLLAGLLPWRFFQVGTSMALWSVAANTSLVSKVFVPRWILVFSSNLANLIGFTFEFLAFLPLMVALGMSLSWIGLMVIPILGLEFFIIFGMSLVLSSVNVYFRDMSQFWEVALQAGFFLCPIFYDKSLVPAVAVGFYSLNPLVTIIESIRQVLYFNMTPTLDPLLNLLMSATLLVTVGYLVFSRLEPRFAEVV